ncbi:CNPV077 hypothetical protein [Canarypox virus]|uniref:Uncharacterized protein CNPV077 n=1 Tax=Canarypox virus TaxID=44088 RepID=Q6VZS0_CNPV|nr:CNPV077 hypothetical protein [Canarypox virus]AAR83423.1 CNPV077 hypothetical protein [Canarypox virus]AWD84553.1 hypothetical protein CNPV077 [Canarypox virus]
MNIVLLFVILLFNSVPDNIGRSEGCGYTDHGDLAFFIYTVLPDTYRTMFNQYQYYFARAQIQDIIIALTEGCETISLV